MARAAPYRAFSDVGFQALVRQSTEQIVVHSNRRRNQLSKAA